MVCKPLKMRSPISPLLLPMCAECDLVQSVFRMGSKTSEVPWGLHNSSDDHKKLNIRASLHFCAVAEIIEVHE